MALRLEFPKLADGKRFNLVQKIALELGVSLSDVSVSESEKVTCINLPDVTESQIDKVNTVMATIKPCDVPNKGINTAYNIPNIWDAQEWLKAQTGLNMTFWLVDIGGVPHIRMNFDHVLTLNEKKALKDALLNNLIEQI